MVHPLSPPTHAQAHVCAFVESVEDLPVLMASCVEDAVSQGAQVVVIAGPGRLGELRSAMEAAGEHEAAGSLRLVTWTRMYSHSRAGFDPTAALHSLQALAAEACAHPTCHGLSMFGHMEWVVSAAGGSAQKIGSYERGVDRFVSNAAEVIAICMYPLRGLSGELLLDLLAAHPMTLVRGQMVESPFHGEGTP
jgi:NAD(P)-dependent dehydrogenase (short-subunit alcohol dehydrogenase family)